MYARSILLNSLNYDKSSHQKEVFMAKKRITNQEVRERILELLSVQASSGPWTFEKLCEEIPVHETTIRFVLNKLLGEELIVNLGYVLK